MADVRGDGGRSETMLDMAGHGALVGEGWRVGIVARTRRDEERCTAQLFWPVDTVEPGAHAVEPVEPVEHAEPEEPADGAGPIAAAASVAAGTVAETPTGSGDPMGETVRGKVLPATGEAIADVAKVGSSAAVDMHGRSSLVWCRRSSRIHRSALSRLAFPGGGGNDSPGPSLVCSLLTAL